jgi:hypothetical protein
MQPRLQQNVMKKLYPSVWTSLHGAAAPCATKAAGGGADAAATARRQLASSAAQHLVKQPGAQTTEEAAASEARSQAQERALRWAGGATGAGAGLWYWRSNQQHAAAAKAAADALASQSRAPAATQRLVVRCLTEPLQWLTGAAGASEPGQLAAELAGVDPASLNQW